MSNFCCAKCAKILPIGYQLGQPTGYVAHEKERICYNCWAKFEIVWMLQHEKVALYLEARPVGEGDWKDWFAVNYSHTLEFKLIQSPNVRKHNIAGAAHHVYFLAPDGAKWHGVAYGNNQLLRCKRLKRQRKNIQPLKENEYLKSYRY